jgi:hypothetical protein
MTTWKKVVVSGSDAQLNSLTSSLAVSASNINVGVPSSNAWGTGLDGSYFNNFTPQTNVSEILRFVAGLLSGSAPNATPNTKTYGSITPTATGTTTGTIAGSIPASHSYATSTTIAYLQERGFATIGQTLFQSQGTTYNAAYTNTYASVFAGSTTVSSSVDTQLFGLGTIVDANTPNTFYVSGTINWRYEDNASSTSTAVSQSENILSLSSFTTSNGLTVGKLTTANPAVIPAAYQDGKFSGIYSSALYNAGRGTTSVSASGYYHISASIKIASGSSPYSTANTSLTRIFWAPTTNIASAIGNNTISANSSNIVTSASFTSGSMSGAPFLTSATYTLSVTGSGIFSPLFASSATVASVAAANLTATGTVTLGLTSGTAALSTAGGAIQTSGLVFNSSNAAKNSGVPAIDDAVRFTNTYTMSGTGRTFAETGATDTNFTIALSALDRSSNSSTLSTDTVLVHTPGAFDQPLASGSLNYFGGGTANTTLIEYFTSESYRRSIGTSTALTGLWDKNSRLALGANGALQVKPGFLVNPESTKGYWYSSASYSTSDYKWFMREVSTGATSNKGTLTITMAPATSADFVDFQATTSDKISIGVIFEAQLPANSGNTRTRIFDAIKGAGSYGGTLNNQATGQYDPFSDNIDMVGDFSGATNTSGTLTLTLNNSLGQTINGTYSKIWLLVRYKGTPANSLTQITVATA